MTEPKKSVRLFQFDYFSFRKIMLSYTVYPIITVWTISCFVCQKNPHKIWFRIDFRSVQTEPPRLGRFASRMQTKIFAFERKHTFECNPSTLWWTVVLYQRPDLASSLVLARAGWPQTPVRPDAYWFLKCCIATSFNIPRGVSRTALSSSCTGWPGP